MEKNFSWQINKDLLHAILNDQLSDRFVCELVWERLFYIKNEKKNLWTFSSNTPVYWSEKFPNAPLIISERSASIHLTRSIGQIHKQSLKEFLNFKGYKIGELYPRKTRRATAVNWLISWARECQTEIKSCGPMPSLLIPPHDPAVGHPDDLQIT